MSKPVEYSWIVRIQRCIDGGYFASTQSQVIYNGGFTSSLGGWGNTSSNNWW